MGARTGGSRRDRVVILNFGRRRAGAEIGIDRMGGDYTSFDLPAADPALCEATCRDDGQCQAFTYVNPGVQGSSPRCWLKNVVPPQVASNCCVSGVVRGGDTPPADGRFANPLVDGNGVDICLNWGVNCGKPRPTSSAVARGLRNPRPRRSRTTARRPSCSATTRSAVRVSATVSARSSAPRRHHRRWAIRTISGGQPLRTSVA